MLDADEVQKQQERLVIHRRNLAELLRQKALQGSFNVNLALPSEIFNQRSEITKLKTILRQHGISVSDHPDDDDGTKKRIFISYKRDISPDELFALELKRVLEQQHTILIDQNIQLGKDWAKQINDDIRSSDAMILLLSEHSVNSEMVLEEVKLAHQLWQTQSRPLILPIRVQYTTTLNYPLSEYLNKIQWTTWNDENDTERVISEIQQALLGKALPILKEQETHTQIPAIPLPFAQPITEIPGGAMKAESQLYIQRQNDEIAINAMTSNNDGITINIKGARQVGKSSFLNKLIHVSNQRNKKVAYIDFQRFGSQILSDDKAFYKQFCANITKKLSLSLKNLNEYWSESEGLFSNTVITTDYIEEYIINEIDQPIVLAMDEVDFMLGASFSSDFFGMLRSWHNERASNDAWNKVDLVLVISTEPYLLINSLEQSPFNVGLMVNMEDFTLEEVTRLNELQQAHCSLNQVQMLHQMLGGHPYLTRKALYLVANNNLTFADLRHGNTYNYAPFDDHLRARWNYLYNKSELLDCFKKIIRNQGCGDSKAIWRLEGAGLIKRKDGSNHLASPRCDVYATYFLEKMNER